MYSLELASGQRTSCPEVIYRVRRAQISKIERQERVGLRNSRL
jgi:hypothetical protein